MKQVINIHLSKDTPAETLTALYAALKAGKEKPSRGKQILYIFNEDIEKLNERYEELFKKVKNSQNLSANQIEKECALLSQKYDFEVEELSKFRKVDYEIRLTEIEARRDEIKPIRRCWLWRLLFKPLTNRAQDIIEERAELNADIIHTEAEKVLDNEWKQLYPDEDKLSKRRLKRLAWEKLKTAIKKANNTETNEAFDALTNDVSPKESTEQAAEPPEPPTRKPRKSKQQLGVNPL